MLDFSRNSVALAGKLFYPAKSDFTSSLKTCVVKHRSTHKPADYHHLVLWIPCLGKKENDLRLFYVKNSFQVLIIRGSFRVPFIIHKFFFASFASVGAGKREKVIIAFLLRFNRRSYQFWFISIAIRVFSLKRRKLFFLVYF